MNFVGDFWWIFSGRFPWKKTGGKNPPKKSTLQGSGLEKIANKQNYEQTGVSELFNLVIFFFPYNPLPPPPRQTPPAVHPRGLDFGPFRLHFGPVRLRFGSVSALFRLRFGSVSGPFGGVGAGSGRGAPVREKNITSLSFFSLVFPKIPRKTSKTPRIFSLCEPLKTLENKQKTSKKTKEFRSRKNTKETKNTKEKKDRVI